MASEVHDETGTDRIGSLNKDDWRCLRCGSQGRCNRRTAPEEDIRFQLHEFVGEGPNAVGVACGEAILDVDVALRLPPMAPERLNESCETGPTLGIIFRILQEHPDTLPLMGSLRPRQGSAMHPCH